MRKSWKKYWQVYQSGWSRILEYRTNFILGRLGSVLITLVMYYVWAALATSGRFAGWSADELFTYVILANVLRAFVFGDQSRRVAEDIKSGNFSRLLYRPVNYFVFNFWLEAAARSLFLFSALVESALLVWVFDIQLVWPSGPDVALLALSAAVIGFTLNFVLTYIASLMAFWTPEAMGPRFLYEWLVYFLSGSFFPLSILQSPLFAVITYLPFFYVIYFPIAVWIGRIEVPGAVFLLMIGTIWLALSSFAARAVWRRGLLRYSGEGA